MNIAIIGAGPAGLCAGRHCLEEKFPFDIFEQTGDVGGTWNYVDSTEDQNGIPVNSSMYKDLATNLPKELMAYEDFAYPNYFESYISQKQVLDYIKCYAKKFRLGNHIKFFKRVLNVEPQEDTWLIEIEDVRNKRKEVRCYDAVMVCNGHCSEAVIPDIPGICNFQGSVSHSRDYRTYDIYKDKRVLVIGAGTSGCDISGRIGFVAKKVYVSCKSEPFFPLANYIHQKPLVTKMDGNMAVFKDGTSAEIDDILYCTGYKYNFPFLSSKCGVNVTENYVHPLYKQIVSIEHPMLAFIGLPLLTCYFPLFDIQVRFFLSSLSGHYQLPLKKTMLQDLNRAVAKMSSRSIHKYHVLCEATGDYFEELAIEANIKRISPVITKLLIYVRTHRNINDRFRIIDDQNWEKL